MALSPLRTSNNAVIWLVVVANLVILYLWLSKQRKKSGTMGEPYTPPNALDIIKTGQLKDLFTLTDKEIKLYASWIDRMEALIKELKAPKTAPAEFSHYAAEINKLTIPNFLKVLNYWQALRKRKLIDSTIFNSGVNDKTGNGSEFLQRLRLIK